MSIETTIAAYQVALNQSNSEAVMALYSSDPVFMPQHVPAQIGREAVRNTYDFVFKTIQLDIVFTTFEIEIMGDLAYARTSSAGRVKQLASGEWSDEGNNELFIFIREEGHWKIHRYLFATNLPPR